MQDDMKKAMPRHLDLRIEYFVVLSATNANANAFPLKKAFKWYAVKWNLNKIK